MHRCMCLDGKEWERLYIPMKKWTEARMGRCKYSENQDESQSCRLSDMEPNGRYTYFLNPKNA